MRKILALVLVLLLVFSAGITVYAKPNKEKHELKIETKTKLESRGEKKENKLKLELHTKFESKAGIQAFKGEIKVNGQKIKFEVPPVIKDGKTLIPVRAVMNGLGAKVEWDPNTKTVTITKGDTVVQFVLGENKVIVNGKEITLDTPAMDISNRTFVPLRFLSEIFGEKVKYDEKTGNIEIETKTEIEIENEENTVSQEVYKSTNETVSGNVYNNDEEVEENE
jgi:hypothetical protein